MSNFLRPVFSLLFNYNVRTEKLHNTFFIKIEKKKFDPEKEKKNHIF